MNDADGDFGGDTASDSDGDTAAYPAERIAVDGLRIEADLDLTVDGDTVRVRSADGRVDVFADRVAALRKLAALRATLAGTVPDAVAGAFDRVPLGVHVGGVEVARVDPGTPPGPLSRALGVAPARLDLGGVARALLRRRR